MVESGKATVCLSSVPFTGYNARAERPCCVLLSE